MLRRMTSNDDAASGRVSRRTVLEIAALTVAAPASWTGCGEAAVDESESGGQSSEAEGTTSSTLDGATSSDQGEQSEGNANSESESDESESDGSESDEGETTDDSDGDTCLSPAVPPLIEGQLVDGIREFELRLQTGRVEWIAGQPTDTYGANGDFLGPTLHLRRGERVRIRVTNALGEATTLHWHGLALPAQSDGGPYQVIAANATWVSEFDVDQPEVMAWYHPHLMHATARHVYMGIAGLIYVDDPATDFALPHTYGVDDIPLVVQDRRFSSDGRHPYSDAGLPQMHDRMAGLKGETILVNGHIDPALQIPQGMVRLRILNASNARNYHFGLSDDREFLHIGGDGGLFEAPIPTNRVLLGPAERGEILIDCTSDSAGTELTLKSYSGEVVDTLFSGMMGGMFADALDAGTFDIARLQVCGQPGSVTDAPNQFAEIERWPESVAVRTRQMVLSMAMGRHLINGATMDDMNNIPDALNLRISDGDFEIWEFVNEAGIAHPMHVHNRHFQVLDVDGGPPPPSLSGFKDTVLVRPGQRIRLILDFHGTPDDQFPYMFHCHILEHEDLGMMGQFFIVES